ncbi:MAG: hypothetical protein KAV87_07515 [Desulfobacteraceae bacterium]|jgi:hypothetical protein|nr:hypothetical protein [Desulfobacteraceae bacterium]
MKTALVIGFSIFFALTFFVFTMSHVYGGPLLQLKKGNIIRIIRVNVDPQKEDDFNRWYSAEHEHMLLKVPGVIWAYKGVNLGERGQKYFYLYVHENMDVQKSDQYKAASQTDWAKEIRPFLRDFEAMNYKVIVPGPIPTHYRKSNIIRTVQVNVDRDHEEDFNNWYNTEHIPLLKEVSGVSVIWRTTNLGEKGQKYLTVYFQENMDVQQREDYKKASQTAWLKSLFPYLKDFSGNNFEIQF